MVYQIAGFYFEIPIVFAPVAKRYSLFACQDPPYPDAVLSSPLADAGWVPDGTRKVLSEQDKLDIKLEQGAIFRQICSYALAHGAHYMHGAVIAYRGHGFLFTADSGTGKTTHIRLWQKEFGADQVSIINGDKPIIRYTDGAYYAYGTPWMGKEKYGTSDRVRLDGICCIERAAVNSVSRLFDSQAVPYLLRQVWVRGETALAQQMELMDGLLAAVPVWLLKCNMEPEAAYIAREALCPDSEDR